MPERLASGFPLFPLGIVALPTEAVPLHIFEDRYRAMIELCLQAEPGSPRGEFGIVCLCDRAGARAYGRRTLEHPRPWHPTVPPTRAPAQSPLPSGGGGVPRRDRRGDRRERGRGG